MLRARSLSVEERGRFDAFVAAHPAGNLLQSWAWGEIRQRQGWRAVRLVADEPDGGIRAAASVLVRDLPVGGRLLYLPRGPVVDFRDAAALGAIVGALRRLAQRERAILVKIDPYVTPPDPEVSRALRRHGFVPGHRRGRFDGMQPRICCILKLRGTADQVLAGFHRKTRYNIRLALRRGVTVRPCGLESLPAFYRLLQETCARDGFRERALGYFEQVWDGLEPGGHIRLFMAEHDGRPLAGSIVTVFGRKAVYAYGASSDTERQLMAPYACQWAAIRWALERGCTSYDMTGIPKRLDPGEPGFGLWRFKRGFCGEQPAEFVGELDLPVSPVLWRAWNLAEPAYWGTRVVLENLRRRLVPSA